MTASAGLSEPVRPSIFAAMQAPHYKRLWASGLLWNLTRWQSVFLCSYLINDLTGAPFLVQMVGSAFFAPMFFGGVIGGIISDRFDRRRTILTQLVLLIPVALLMASLVGSGSVKVWMVYPYMLIVGVGGVVDMTSRRALVYEFVGESRVNNALALEQLSATSGNLLGTLLGGTFIALVGIGPAFAGIAACYALSFVLLLRVQSPPRLLAKGAGRTAVLDELRAAVAYVRGSRTLVSILGVTVIVNLFYFSFMPLVPVFAARLEVSAFWAGVLASGTSIGSVIGGLMIARGLPFGRGLAYVGGSALAMTALFVFAAAPVYLLALVALIVAGTGNAGFATMQSVLVLVSSTPEMRGRAMGLLSMAIGALPFSMLILGGFAQVAGPSMAVMGSVVLGVIVMAIWTRVWPEAHRVA
ncbi:MAG: MFS transporter [Dehalococcoidia bacterium]